LSYKPKVLAVADGGTGDNTLTNHGVLVGAGTSAVTQLAAGTAGQVLQSGGGSADPAYSTATFPATAGTTGSSLISNGTNFVSSLANTAKPCFLATMTTAVTNAWGDGPYYTVVCNTSIFDQASNFSSGIFTAPVTGKYIFNALVNLSNTGGTVAASATMQLLATSRTMIGQALPFITGDPNNFISLASTWIVDMTAADTVRIQIAGNTTASTKTGTFYGAAGTAYTYFSGFLI